MNKKEAILDVARELFQKQGYAQTSLEDIAQSLNIRKSGIYYYFPNKEALFYQTFSSEWIEDLEQFGKSLATKADLDQRILQYAQLTIRHVRNILLHYGTSAQIVLETRKLFRSKTIVRIQEMKTAFYTHSIQEGQTQGLYRSDISAENLGKQLMSLSDALETRHLYYMEKTHPEMADYDEIEKNLIEIITYILAGIKKNI